MLAFVCRWNPLGSQALERERGAMALAIDATVRVDSRRATVHWHNEHDKAQEVARQADTHEVAQDVLCHELRALEVLPHGFSNFESSTEALIDFEEVDSGR